MDTIQFWYTDQARLYEDSLFFNFIVFRSYFVAYLGIRVYFLGEIGDNSRSSKFYIVY